MSKKFSIEQLSKVTGWETKKLASLLLSLKKISNRQDVILTKLAQVGQGAGKGMVNPVGDVVEGLQRKLPERAPQHGTGEVPLAQHVDFIIKKIQRSPMPPPDANDVVQLLTEAVRNPEAAKAYVRQAAYLVQQNLKAWTNAMDAPNSAEWKRLLLIVDSARA